MKIMENFVLKIQEREEAIQLLAMDPQVYGELLTHHRRGHGVDEEALRIRIPPPAGHQNVPQMGSCGDRSLRRRKSIFVDLSRSFGFFRNLQAEEVGKMSHKGPTSLLGVGPLAAPSGLVRSPDGPCLGSHVPCISSFSEKIFSEVLFCLDTV